MEIVGNTIYVISWPVFFHKERVGLKPNTIRKIPDDEKEIILNGIFKLKFINVTNTEDNNETFARNITDISFFEDLMIISWDHNSSGDR